jgi:hypothetical protein
VRRHFPATWWTVRYKEIAASYMREDVPLNQQCRERLEDVCAMSWIRQRQYLGLKSEVDEYLGQHAHLDSPSTLLIQEKNDTISNGPSGTGTATEQKRMILSNFQSLARMLGYLCIL